MKRLLSLPAVLAAALFSFVVTIPFLPSSYRNAEIYTLEIAMASDSPGNAQVFFDIGRGYNEADSSRLPIEAGRELVTLKFKLPLGSYRGLRFDPTDRKAILTVGSARILDPKGKLVRSFAAADFRAAEQIASIEPHGNTEVVTIAPPYNDPSLHIAGVNGLELTRNAEWHVGIAVLYTLPVFVLCLGALALPGLLASERRAALATKVAGLRAWGAAHPQRAVAIIALLSVVASSYPVIFLNKSFVSPNFGPLLLYENFPTLPGYKESHVEDVRGADVGAVMWMHLPLTVLEYRAIFQDHELPLWNRNNGAGVPLLAQSQSMLGDPVHMLLPMLFDGAAWAWDLKYLVAKWLLACGLGLIVWHGTRHLGAAMIVAFAADFVGVFVFRVNHPAIFSFCYAPWILYCWMRGVQAPTLGSAGAWTGGLVLANLSQMASGTAKEAYMLLLCLNFTGFLVLACDGAPWLARARRLALFAWGGVVFALLSAPLWLTFMSALKKAFTVYDQPAAVPIEPRLFAGFWDEILYRPFNGDLLFFPSANFLFLAGMIGFVVYYRTVLANRVARALAIGALLPFSIAFGVISPFWIIRIPVVGNVIHVGNTFSIVLIVHVAALAGFGFWAAAKKLGDPEGRFDLGAGVLWVFALMASYLPGFYTQTTNGFITTSVFLLPAAVVLLMFVARRMLSRRAVTPAGVFLVMAVGAILLWRHGFHAGTGFSSLALKPTSRVDFHAKSKAVTAVLADRTQPYRAVGLEGNLFPGWSNVYGLEGINGPDPLLNRQYRELLEAGEIDRIWGWRVMVHADTLPRLHPIYDFLNVKYYFDFRSDQGRMGAMLTPLIMADCDVYKSETPWPRAFFTDQLEHYDEVKQLTNLVMTDSSRRPFAAVQWNQTNTPQLHRHNFADRTVVPATSYKLTTNTTSFVVNAPSAGVAVLHEAWWPDDFQVKVNGKPAAYFRVNHAFMGVEIPESGNYEITFSYWPDAVTHALIAFALGVAALGGSAWGLSRYRHVALGATPVV